MPSGIAPWYVTQTNPPMTMNLPINAAGQGPDLTGLAPSNFQLEIINSRGVISYGTGTFKVIQANPGIVQYKPSNADVQIADTYTIKLIVNFSDGPDFFGPYTWTISPK